MRVLFFKRESRFYNANIFSEIVVSKSKFERAVFKIGIELCVGTNDNIGLV